MSGSNIYSTYEWRQVRAYFKKHEPAEGYECAICGDLVNPQAPPRSRGTLSIDHRIPVAKGGAPYSLDNLRPTHLACNSSRCARGDAEVEMMQPTGSQVW
ncbi:HNH endonuclease [Rhodococcus sp. AQ5-07]|uniref:HNH endonuclease n=1 Tax=Rhodococcus sp. AQ5-07 TaxID=2054902 RepID=UPI0012B66352|nr:HNH endonuclease signature motif containing protein [Rhodococcus sp. AQ5-07]